MKQQNQTFHKIRQADIKELSKLFADCFCNDPLYVYFFPNPEKRKRCAKYLFEYELRSALNFTYANQNNTACIVYKKSSDCSAKVSPLFAVRLFFAVGPRSVVKAMQYLSFCEKKKHAFKPQNAAYLSLLCVDRSLRNQGVAKAMISALTGGTVYLETQNPVNVQIYKKLGFQLVDQSCFAQNVMHYCMLKKQDAQG